MENLLDYMKDNNCVEWCVGAPLDLRACSEKTNCAAFFRINAPDKHGYTPLHCATYERCSEDILVRVSFARVWTRVVGASARSRASLIIRSQR